MQKYLGALLAIGLNASQAVGYTSAAFSNGAKNASYQLPSALRAASVPQMPVDTDAVLALWRTRISGWTPEVETFVRAALPKAVASGNFGVGSALRYAASQLVTSLAQHSGLARPAGV
jgi:hypothetical protein